MRFATLGSGSSGNATAVHAGDALILIDCGLSVAESERRATRLDLDLSTLNAIVVTHEHDDHVGGVARLARRYDVPVYATRGTLRGAGERLSGDVSITVIEPGSAFAVGDLHLLPVIVPHDATEPCQFVISDGSLRLGVLTDFGQSTPHLTHHFDQLDALVLEFNHDADMLARGPYPASLKRRVGGPFGHLSNAQAEAMLQSLDLNNLQQFVAAHLSQQNNAPAMVEDCLERCLPAQTARFIAAQDTPSPWFELRPNVSF